jgi:hypothetical protein
MRLYVGLSLMCWLLACASGSSTTIATENYGFKGDLVWVRGPWSQIKPSKDIDHVVDQLCPVIMRLPNADRGQHGQEYCGALYLTGGIYYASHPSPLGGTVRLGDGLAEMKCRPPRYVDDARGQVTIIADYHSHPWATPMSPRDRQGPNQRWSIRIQFDTKCRVMKLVPYIGEDRPGELYERQGKSWVLIGIIKPEDKDAGIITEVRQ